MAVSPRPRQPLAQRICAEGEPFQAFDSGLHGDPATPVMEAFAGDPVNTHVLAAFSEQAPEFTIDGHQWPVEPGRDRHRHVELCTARQAGANARPLGQRAGRSHCSPKLASFSSGLNFLSQARSGMSKAPIPADWASPPCVTVHLGAVKIGLALSQHPWYPSGDPLLTTNASARR